MEKIMQALEITFRRPRVILTLALISAIPNILYFFGFLHYDSTTNLGLAIVGLLGAALVGVLMVGAQAHIFNRAYDNEPASLWEALAFAANKWLPLLCISVAYGVIVGVGLVLCFVPGIILSLKYGFATFIVALEDRKVGDALSRSGMLTQGRLWEMFAATFVAALPLILVQTFFLGLGPDLGFATDPIALAGVEILSSLTFIFEGLIMFCFYRDALQAEQDMYETDRVLADARATAPSEPNSLPPEPLPLDPSNTL